MCLAHNNDSITRNDNDCWSMCVVLHIDDDELDNDYTTAVHELSLAMEHRELRLDIDWE